MPDWPATGALLACYQRPFEVQSSTFYERFDNQLIDCWLQTCFFCTCYLYLQMICLNLCNAFSKPYLSFQRIKMKRSLYRRRITGYRVDGLGYVFVEWTTSALPLTIRKASTHWTEEPFLLQHKDMPFTQGEYGKDLGVTEKDLVN